MDCTSTAALTNYFNLLEEYLKKIDNPAQIYNMDKTGVPLDPRAPNVVAKRGQKKVRYRMSGKKEQITVIGCINAIGQSIPPMVIFDGKYLNHLWTANEIPGTFYGMSNKGWTDQELFCHWLRKHFVKYAVPGRPILLLLDGHSSHYEPRSVQAARDMDIIFFRLPPHTSHESQPLDCSVFRAFKQHWSDACHEYQQTNPGVVLTKYNFNKVFSVAWLRALTPSNIVAGFKKCGVHPFNRNAIVPTDAAVTDHPGSSDRPRASFPPEKEQLFIKRFEEGYNLQDEEHEEWLRETHAEETKSTTDILLHPFKDELGEILALETSLSSPELFPEFPMHSSRIVSVPSSTVDSGVDSILSSQATSGTATPSTPPAAVTIPSTPSSAAKIPGTSSAAAMTQDTHSAATTPGTPSAAATPPGTAGTTQGTPSTATTSGTAASTPSTATTPGTTATSQGTPSAATTVGTAVSTPGIPSVATTSGITATTQSTPSATTTLGTTVMTQGTPIAATTPGIAASTPGTPSVVTTPGTTTTTQSTPLATTTPGTTVMTQGTPSAVATTRGINTDSEVSPLTKFLVVPKPMFQSTPVARYKTRALSGSRVFTSDECFEVIKKQAEKKKLKEAERAMKQLEREEKKKQREKEKQKKADERARKAEKRAKKAEEMAKEKARKAKEKARKRLEQEKKAKKMKKVKDTGLNIAVRESLRLRTPQQSKPDSDEEIMSDQCCICYDYYCEDNGLDWIQCPCTRWLHEDCIIDSEITSDGKEVFCSHCIH